MDQGQEIVTRERYEAEEAEERAKRAAWLRSELESLEKKS